MSSAVWERNLALLRSHYPELAKQIETDAGCRCSSWHLEQTPAGSATLIYRENPESPGVLIHSKHDPVREGLRQAETALEKNPVESTTGPEPSVGEGFTKESSSGTPPAQLIILLGFGLGYTAEALAKGGHTLIVVERRKELFRLALEQRNMEALLSPGRAIFIIGGEAGGITAALALLEKQDAQKPLVVKNRALCTLTEEDESWYAETARRISAWFSKDEINAATLQRFGKRWTRNLAANIQGVLQFPGVKYLEGIFNSTDVPVFLAAAGPSLNKAEPFLKEIHRRCVTVAVDTSLRFLLRQGIEPDFVVSVDPQFWNALHLYRLSAPRTALIAESAVYPSTLKGTVFGRVFFCQSFFPLGRFIEDRTDPKGQLGAGGSVATTAWDFARLLGPASVWIAGLDLAFPGYRTHFKGALFEENVHAASRRFCPAETLSVQSLENGIPFYARSAGSGKVLTDKRLSLYAAWFENRFEQTGLTNYNFSPEGLAVSGFVNSDPEKLLFLPPRRDTIDSVLETVYRRVDDEFNEAKKERTERYTLAHACLIKGLEEIRDNAEEAARAVKTISSHLKPGKDTIEKTLKKLDKINSVIAASPVKDSAGFLFPPVSELEKELRETDNLKRHLEFSLLFYQSLSDSVDFTLRFLKPRDLDLSKNPAHA